MLRYVPDFIIQKSRNGENSGTLDAFVLFIDVANFTSVSNELRKMGKLGAEILYRYLFSSLANPIKQVELNGGFISHFAGDAFCAIFPDAVPFRVGHTVEAIREQFTPTTQFQTEMGEYPIKLRMAVSCGTLEWNIYRNEKQHEYVFSGKPLVEIERLGRQKKELALSEAVETAFAEADVTDKTIPQALDSFKPEQDSAFINRRLQDTNPDNEIRDGAYCFVDLSHLPEERIEAAIALMHEKLDDYGGYINKLDYSDKGLVALILFGLPRGLGNTLERACRFTLETIAEIPELSIGLSCGTAYAGYVGSDTTREYTALGAAVNLASRLMQKAGKGEILTDSYLEQDMHHKYKFEAAESVNLKGFAAAVNSHRLIDRLPAPQQSFMAELVGRETEIELIYHAVEAAGSRILYISGEPGIGKSRLILEALKLYPKKYFLFCDPSGHKLLEPIKQFLRQYFAYDPLLSREQNQNSFRAQWEKLAGEDKELQRIESIVGDFLGYEWQGSIWSMLPPNERPEQQRKAFATMMARITETEKVLIHLDDPQWLDNTDVEYFQQLGIAGLKGVVIIAACRYQEDGTNVNLEIPNWEARHQDLSRLSEEAAARLINNLLNVDAIPAETQDWIVKKADGNPLFLEQVVAYLKENHCFDQDYRLKGNLDYLSSFGIADIIGSRIDSLTEAVRNTLQHACVLGLEFNTRVLSEMLSRKLDDDLGEGKQARVWADIDELRYIFTHVLIKDTAYNRMLSDKLKALHLLAAETMERLYQVDEKALNEHAEEIAEHFKNVGLEKKAAEYFDKAGCWYRENYKFDKGEAFLKNAVSIREKVLGDEHTDTASSLSNLASLYRVQGKYLQAEPLFLRARDIRDKALGAEHPDTAGNLISLANMYKEQGKFDQAEPLYLKAMDIWQKVLGSEHPDTALAMNNLAGLYSAQGKYKQAEPLYLSALNVRQKVLSPEHPDTATSLNNLASLYRAQGKYEQAEPLCLLSLDYRQKTLGPWHPDTATSLNNLAGLYHALGKNEQVETMYLRALDIRQKIFGTWHLNTATSLNNLAFFYDGKSKYDQAEPLYIRTVEILEYAFGMEHPYLATSLCNLAGVYVRQGKYTQAEPLFLRALAIREKVLGTEHPNTAMSLSNLAYLYNSQGKYDQAKPLYLRALSIFVKTLGGEHLYTVTLLDNLALLYSSQGKFKQAEPMFLRALTIREKVLGAEHPDTANSLNNLAGVYTDQGDYKKAEQLFLQALETREKVLGAEHPDTGTTLNNLACLHKAQGKYEQALPPYMRALEIRRKNNGCEHEDTQNTIKGLVDTYEKLNQPEKAAEYRAMLIEPVP